MEVLKVILCFLSLGTLDAQNYSGKGETPQYWNDLGKADINKARKLKPNIGVAKNVIIFLGDGMGISTVTAARILKGQLQGQPGEESKLVFEEFPHVALSKTYNQDAQTPDSSATATAYYTGVKANLGTMGLDASARRSNCSFTDEAKIESILDWSLAAGKSVGIVTTTRVTHATPGALYASIPERNWENDNDMADVANCSVKDIAAQLIENPNIQVVFGGGRSKFLMNNTEDPENGIITDGRLDRDLVEEWKSIQNGKDRRYKYVWNKTDFDNINPQDTDYVMGLFESSHMQYVLDRDTDVAGEPTLAEMTEKAIDILKKNEKGFFLLVEGGRIDHGHHASMAKRALHEVIAFDDAIRTGVTKTSESDTLIVTTADHSHVFTMGGYPSRGNDIFGLTDDKGEHLKLAGDSQPFTTLGYTNGPGGYATGLNESRPNLTSVDTGHKDFVQQSGVKLESETHGGEDVGIYARGPMSHLFHGVHEQSYIAHVMAYSSCVGRYSDPESCAMVDVKENEISSGSTMRMTVWMLAISALVYICI
ncbi:alkaline phosphatase-like isoform X2 [Mya arenaria]|uniref:alkaline phosphatase-like isoform X2 n=1 Tax=Mya arenaria TaxID=6604 RepID=UPI0022E75AD9|nr:alkaline phosphatase-like isoform X2 [Mya arenaria]